MVYEFSFSTQRESVRATSTALEREAVRFQHSTRQMHVAPSGLPRHHSALRKLPERSKGGRGRSQRYHIPTKAVTVDVEEVSSGRDGSTVGNIAE